MNAPRCPDKETLFGYVVGTITEDVAEAVAKHLLACRSCEQTVEALEGLSDPVVSALQQAAPSDAYAEEPACRQVLQQLQALRVGGPDSDSDKPVATASQPPEPSRSTKRLGDYELLKMLGQGGMGTVYQAQHVRLKRIVALKVLPKNCLGNTAAIARFEREIEAVGRLDHPHIVRAMDAREVDGVRFLVMEHVDGLNLAEVVARCGPLSVADACEVTRQAALGLQCSEEHGLVHRDIKPSNLMLNTEGQIKVLDLGLAQFQEAQALDRQVTGIGQLMGTPDYISPEQALASDAVDIRTDIYALGCTLYYLLTGQRPFSGSQYDTPMKKVTGHLRDAVPPIDRLRTDLPKPLVALLARMLTKSASQRVARPAEVVSSLAPLCTGSKLIGLLREARAHEEPAHDEAEGLQVSAWVDTSRDERAPSPRPEEPAAGAADFDPYHRWLGIAPAEQPADHYRLLGIARFESDPEVIRDASMRQMAHVRTYHLGPHAERSQKILNELGMAKACLLDPQKKAAYDAECRQRQAAAVRDAPSPPPPPAPGEEFAAFVTEPDWDIEGSSATAQLSRRVATSCPPGARSRWAQQVALGLRTPVGIATVVAGLLTVLLLGVVIRAQTNYGTVKIEILEENANVEVKLDGETISVEGLGQPLRLRPGAHELVVNGRDYETVCTSFTVRRGNNPVLTVTLVPTNAAPPDVPVQANSQQKVAPEQQAAAEKLGLPVMITNSIGMQLVLIPAGEFIMGRRESPEELAHMYAKWDVPPEAFAREYPQHRVRITKPFYLGMHEVTIQQFRQFVAAKNFRTGAEQSVAGGCGYDASENTMVQRRQYHWQNPGFSQSADHPVVIVSWNDAVAFCNWLSDQEGKCYSLPTEAQWEYACRGGTTTQFYNGDDPEKLTLVGNVEDATAKAEFKNLPWPERTVSSSDGYAFTSPVGKYQANPWGLYDTHGNVWEWCADWYDEGYYANSPASDPPGPATGSFRVSRGGSWNEHAMFLCRAAARRYCLPGAGIFDVGFRIAIAPSVNEPTLAGTDSKSAVSPEVLQPPGQSIATDAQQAAAITGREGAGDWQPLFDGQTLNGWRATGSGTWSVESNAIIGRKAATERGQGQLITDGEFGDFALRMKFKILGGDSGIYFRGREGGRLGFFGPQVQLMPPDDVGGLLELQQQDERTMTRIAAPPNASQRFFKPNDWNDLELNAKGAQVSVCINGVPTAELFDEVYYCSGKLAIQVWGDNDTEVILKDIVIRPNSQLKDNEVQHAAQQCRKAVQEQDWETARKCGALLLTAARRGAQERTVAQVTLLCQGLRRDPPDATVTKYLQGLDSPGAFAPDVGPPKTSPPNPVDQDRISKDVQQNYGPEYRKAETDPQKRDFAEGILTAARSTTDPKDPATRYVLLEWVSHLAAEAHDWALGGEAIEARAAEFQGVDVLSEQWQLCEALASAIKDPLEQRRLARQLLSFAHVALDDERLELAQQFLNEARKVVLRAKDKGVNAEVQQTDKLVELLVPERQLAQSAISTLEGDPLDAAANEKVGRFYCLAMGQWNRGLPWLAMGSDQRLGNLAAQELGLLVDATQFPPPVALRRKLAEDWSAVAESEAGRARGMALGRAYYWYREVLRDVTGPDKNIVSKLLRDMRDTGDLIVSAPDDAKPYCGHYYKCFAVPMTWHVARRECEELGGHLARIESLSENRLLWQRWGGPGTNWNVDGSDELQEGSWIFGNGEPLTFTNWQSEQPDDGRGSNGEHCYAVNPPEGKWIDHHTGVRIISICEWDCRLIRVHPRGEPPNRRPPRNAVAFGGHHYALIEQPGVTWHVAQEICASQGGHLVRIQSLEEYEFVKRLAAQSQSPWFWVDGNDELAEGLWVDSEGEPLAYLPWHPGQPDNGSEVEHIAGLFRGEFNDEPCGGRSPFICEWDR